VGDRGALGGVGGGDRGLTGVMLAVAIAGVRQGRWTRAGAGGWLVAALWAVLSAVVFATGGLGLAAPFALVLVPMLAVLLVGPRAGLAWTGIILAQVGVLAVLHLGGFAFPHQVFEGGGRYVTGLAAVIALLSGAASSRTCAAGRSSPISPPRGSRSTPPGGGPGRRGRPRAGSSPA
jgi:hypothetical protein